jgi:phosphoribosylamine--glycine ligase
VLLACVEQRLAQLPPFTWTPGVATCVVAASGGYPDTFTKGHEITGLAAAEASGAIVFHAGTRQQKGVPVTDGGRVLGVTAMGDTFQAAIAQTYAALDCIQFDGLYARRDIGHQMQAH